MPSVLRDYQRRCVDSIYRYLQKRDDNPCAIIPTGGGKSLVMAQICRDTVKEWNGRVILLAHVKELLEQSYHHLQRADETLPIGIYSAGLGARDTGYPVTIAGIQSAYRNADDFPPVDLIIADEAHRIPPDGEGQYRTFLAAMKAKNPQVRLIGFTATPYRTSTGAICGRQNLLNRICFEVGVRELIQGGFLSPLVTRGGQVDTDFSGVAVRRDEFDQNQLETLMSEDVKVATAISDIFHRAKDRKKILIFASGVDHGRKIVEFLKSEPEEAGSVGQIYGDTDSDERARLVKSFRDGDLRILVNVDVLTLGFDAPNVDCVALMRATMSPGLYYQMVGRGFRIAPGKKDCLVLDFGENVIRHGPVDVLAPEEKREGRDGGGEAGAPCKKCPECCLIVAAGASSCPECKYEFPRRAARHEAQSYDGSVVSQEREACPVLAVQYDKHYSTSSGKYSLQVSYQVSDLGVWVNEFVCLEHSGWAGDKAAAWWSRRASTPAPRTIDEALARAGELAKPVSVLVNTRGKYPEITHYKFAKEGAAAG